MSSSASTARDFELLQEYLDDNQEPLYVDGQILDDGEPRDAGECCADCSFSRMAPTARQPVLFVCKRHRRVHVCGEECTHKIISHEDASCEWTGEMMRGRLIAEVVNRHQIHARSQACRSSATSHEQNKGFDRHQRIKTAMEDVGKICGDAICKVEKKKGAFVSALRQYFGVINKQTDAFDRTGLNSKRILQFGLACTYLHRTGVTAGGAVLFKMLPDMKKHLPKTHALIKKEIKVTSITRNEVLLKELMKKQQANNLPLDIFAFPDF